MIETEERGPENIYEALHRGGIKVVTGSGPVESYTCPVMLKLVFLLM